MSANYDLGQPATIILDDTANNITPPLRGLCITATGTIKFTSYGTDVTLIVAAAPWVPPYGSISRVFLTGTVTITASTVHGIR